MPESRRNVVGPPEADEQYRVRALKQLWKLRDDELVRAGHSTPAYIAARVANEFGYPQPPAPKSKAAIDWEVRNPGRPTAVPMASWCDPDREIVTGEHRAQLMQWLPEVVDGWTTKRQLSVLDGITDRTSLTYIRELLASEGFQQVCDVYGNAGPAPQPRELYDYHPVYAQARLDAAAERPARTSVAVANRVALVLCSPADGFLATVYATDVGRDVLRVENVAVYYNVMILDRDLLWAGTAGSQRLAYDENGDLTTVLVGDVSNMPGLRNGGSLRVGLAVLRAFARPIAPWFERPLVCFGENPALMERRDEILARLPAWVHELLGRQLTTPSTQ